MNNTEQSIQNTVRFDTKLESFNDIITLFSDNLNRIKESGKKVIAKSPLFPAEPIYAAGGLAYDPYLYEVIPALIKGKRHLIGKATDAGLSSDLNFCNLIMAGAFISGENEISVDAHSAACGFWDDQISNTWQMMAEASQKPIHFWEVPRFDNNTEKWAINFLIKELEQYFEWLTNQTGNSITENSLREAVRMGNLIRQDIIELNQLLQNQEILFPALEYYITQLMISDFAQNPERLHVAYQKLIQELKERQLNHSKPADSSEKAIRIFLTGEEIPDIRIWNQIEDYGGIIVGFDSRMSLYYKPIKEDGPIIENLACWIYGMPSSMPTAQRMNSTISFIKSQKPDAVIISSIAGSTIFPESNTLISQIIQDELGVPIFYLETKFPFEIVKPTYQELEAFIQNLKDGKNRG
ncbi:MAG: 2-hydroxyacyl-CoA dehydratase [Dehalococcoidia bacterium]|nr:MAG: 2-hydroxyacyl-CoA dehydratase [Dehalococcoidia bacterium]